MVVSHPRCRALRGKCRRWLGASLPFLGAACSRSPLFGVGVPGAGNPDSAPTYGAGGASADGRDAGDASAGASATDGGRQHGCVPPRVLDDASGGAPWSWDFGDGASQTGEYVQVDAEGNVYLAGRFEGAIELGGTTFRADGTANEFASKLDARGQVLWARSFEGTFDVRAMKVTAEGTLVLGGMLSGPTDLGETAGSPAVHGAFVVALDGCGKRLRSTLLETGPGTNADISGLDVRRNGNVVVAGSFEGSIDLGPGEITGGGIGSYEHFVTELTQAGLPVWTRRFGRDTGPLLVGAGGDGDTYVATRLTGTLDLDGHSIEGQLMSVVTRLDASGAPRWILHNTQGAELSATPDSIAVDADGAVWLGGGFLSHGAVGDSGVGGLDFGRGVATSYACCGDNAFVVKVDPGGTPLWIRSFGGLSQGALVATRGPRAVAVSQGGDRSFLARVLGPTGDVIARQSGVGGFPHAESVDIDSYGAVFVTGTFYDDLSFGQNQRLVAGPGLDWDGFVAKLVP